MFRAVSFYRQIRARDDASFALFLFYTEMKRLLFCVTRDIFFRRGLVERHPFVLKSRVRLYSVRGIKFPVQH